MRITRDAALAEDAVQEALFNAWKHIEDFDGRSSFKTWLHRIAVNAALEQMRRNARHETVDLAAGSDEDSDDFLLRRSADDPVRNSRPSATKSAAMSRTTSAA